LAATARQVDALLIVLVCELSASPGWLIDAINPSSRGRATIRETILNCQSSRKGQEQEKEKGETRPRDISSFTAPFPPPGRKVGSKYDTENGQMHFDILSARDGATRDTIPFVIIYKRVIMKISDSYECRAGHRWIMLISRAREISCV
jgi:hypothetical protein